MPSLVFSFFSYLAFSQALTCSEIDHRCCSSSDGINLRVDFMFGFIHFVLNPNPGCLLVEENESYWHSSQCVIFSSYQLSFTGLKD